MIYKLTVELIAIGESSQFSLLPNFRPASTVCVIKVFPKLVIDPFEPKKK